MKKNRKLIVVSTRLPIRLVRKVAGEFLLEQSTDNTINTINALLHQPDFLEKTGIDQVEWIGAADFTLNTWRSDLAILEDLPYRLHPVFLSKKMEEGAFKGFTHSTLYPLLIALPGHSEINPEWYAQFKAVNYEFCREVQNIAGPDDLVWIHDYGLMLLPDMLRQRMPEMVIGYYQHAPFPHRSILQILPDAWRRELLEGMLGADFTGFQTHEFAGYFQDAARAMAGAERDGDWLSTRFHQSRTGVLPMGVDAARIRELTGLHTVEAMANDVREIMGHRKIIFSKERLGYARGILQRLLAYETLLRLHPEWREKVVFLLHLMPEPETGSRLSERKKLIEDTVQRINTEWGDPDWRPVVYRQLDFEPETLTACYLAADVALITPLCRGMSLPAKEFVAAHADEKGVLVLSEQDAAVADLADALVVHPHDQADMVNCLHTALRMPPEQQQQRMRRLHAQVTAFDVQRWAIDFMDATDEAAARRAAFNPALLTPESSQQLIRRFHTAPRRLLMLDYEGTLTTPEYGPQGHTPDPELLAKLERLCSNEHNTVAITSGYSSAELDRWFGKLQLILVAENGAKGRFMGKPWQTMINDRADWKPAVRQAMDYFTARCPGSKIEEQEHSLVWDYSQTENTAGERMSGMLIGRIETLLPGQPVQVNKNHKRIEVRTALLNKGRMADWIVRQARFDLALVVGNDKKDEDMFASMDKSNSITIRVGKSGSCAQHCVLSHESVIDLLESLTLASIPQRVEPALT